MIAANNQHEIGKIASAFQTKVVKYLESTLAAEGGVDRIRTGLSMYTSSRAVFNDLTKMVCVLGAREALAELHEALPPKIDGLEGKALANVHGLLKNFTTKHPAAIPFALTIVVNHLKTPWQLIHLTVRQKGKTELAPMPHAVVVPMVLDQIDERRLILRGVLKNKRVLVAKDLLNDIDNTAGALRSRADLIGESDYRQRLDDMMAAVEALVAAEVQSLPGNIHHVLGARGGRGNSLAGRLTSVFRKLVTPSD
jgi:hypothetical protein